MTAADPGLELYAAIARCKTSRDHGIRWLLDHIDGDGKPVGADERNGWGRVPWALAVSGESAAAARVIAWAERGQLSPETGFAPGVALGADRFTAYPLAHFAIGAWLTERFGTALEAVDVLRRRQDPITGGLPVAREADRASELSDLLSTAQAGLAAIITGQDDVADLCWRWISDLVASQPADAGSRLFTFRRGKELVTQPTDALKWMAITDFSKPQQSYYTPGMAAVFLAGYAQRRARPDALEVATALMRFNIEGCAAQFEDSNAVQICKFGWGAAAMFIADPSGDWLPHVLRMGDWFIEHQQDDGSWVPSGYLSPQPSDIDKLVKTSEHAMELNAILASLGTALALAPAAAARGLDPAATA